VAKSGNRVDDLPAQKPECNLRKSQNLTASRPMADVVIINPRFEMFIMGSRGDASQAHREASASPRRGTDHWAPPPA
jgi:hypothetical protein